MRFVTSQVAVEVTPIRISLDSLASISPEPSQGAQIIFSGVVRNENFGKKVIAVSYDAFVPLAETTFELIAQEAIEKWGPDLKVTVVHRIGRLEVGEVSVGVIIGAPHRHEAYQASRFVIDQIKHRAPIWKKEHYEEGETEWLDGHALCGPQEVP